MEPYVPRRLPDGDADTAMMTDSNAAFISLGDGVDPSSSPRTLRPARSTGRKVLSVMRTIGCCLCAPIKCAIRYVMMVVLTVVVIATIIAVLLYVVLRQTGVELILIPGNISSSNSSSIGF